MANIEMETFGMRANQAPNVIHVIDERRRVALAEIDNAAFSWFHAKVCVVAGVGFFTDAYDIFAINIASPMLGYVYGHSINGNNQTLNWSQDLGLKVAAPVGNIFGQVLFGWLADRVGRKRMYGVELVIMITATFSQALSGSGGVISIIGVLIVWRFIMGVGVGGDYPLSAVIASEFASTRIRGRMMTAVFASQGWGNFAGALVGFILVVAYKNAILHDNAVSPHHVDYVWRILIGLGCVPACLALYFRLTIPETPRFTMDVERNVQRATADIQLVLTAEELEFHPDLQLAEVPRATWADFRRHFSRWENGAVLFGTAYSWFAIDIAFYGLNLNTSIILPAIGFGNTSTTNTTQDIYNTLYKLCVGNMIISAAGLLPGYYVCMALIDSWGRKRIQFMGFAVLTILLATMGFAYDKLNATPASRKAFFFLYCLANFFQNFGPNVTTFIIPGEIFPTRYRSTAHGISAGSGKVGAVVSQVVFAVLKNDGFKFVKHILEIFALFTLSGFFSTLLLPETKGRSLEELSNEDQQGFITGIAGQGDHGVVLDPPR